MKLRTETEEQSNDAIPEQRKRLQHSNQKQPYTSFQSLLTMADSPSSVSINKQKNKTNRADSGDGEL